MIEPSPSPDPTTAPHDPKARQVELLISRLLSVGVMASLGIVCLGTVISFVHHPQYLSQRQSLPRLATPGAAFPHTIRQVFAGVADFRGQSVVALGLLLLIATPVLRVAVSVAAFVYEKDRRYVLITSIVLALLLVSFVIGQAG